MKKIMSVLIVMILLLLSINCYAAELRKGDKIQLDTTKFTDYFIFRYSDDLVEFVKLALVDKDAAVKYIISKTPNAGYHVTPKDICFIEDIEHITKTSMLLQLRVKGDYKHYYTFTTDAFIKVK